MIESTIKKKKKTLCFVGAVNKRIRLAEIKETKDTIYHVYKFLISAHNIDREKKNGWRV